VSHDERIAAADGTRYEMRASRLLGVYQTACLTLQKLKAKGQQRVLVNPSNVTGAVRLWSQGRCRGRSGASGGDKQNWR